MKVKIFMTLVIITILCSVSLGIALTRTITDSSDTISTFISCSNGNLYSPTYANLQTALGLGGTITLPECNISITDTALTMSVDGTILRGIGKKSQLFLSGGSNYRNMINVTGDDCFIEYISFDVNNDSQNYTKKCRAIFLDAQCQRATVQNCVFDNGSFTLIGTASTSLQGDHMIFNNHIKGRHHTGIAAGICIRGDGCQVIGNRVEDTFGSGIAMEGGTFTNKTIVSNNYCTGENGVMSVGIYMEDTASYTAIISNNICTYINGTAYGGSPDGVGILAEDNSRIIGNYVYRAYRFGISCNDWCIVMGNEVNETFLSTGIIVDDYCTVIGNNIYNREWGGASGKAPQYGIKVNGEGCIINSNNISGMGGIVFGYGIHSKDDNCSINNNHIAYCHTGIRVESANFYQIDNNKILHCGRNDFGNEKNSSIDVLTSMFAHITNNICLGSYWGIRLQASHNCTVISNTVESSQANFAIFERTSGNCNVILFNNLRMSSGTVTILGANSINNASSAGRTDWNWY